MLQKKRLEQCRNILADLLEEMEGGEVDRHGAVSNRDIGSEGPPAFVQTDGLGDTFDLVALRKIITRS